MTDSVCQATFKGWMDIMYAAVDSRKVRTYMVKRNLRWLGNKQHGESIKKEKGRENGRGKFLLGY
jgi:hypothetical protein